MSLPAPAGRPVTGAARLPLEVRRLGLVPYAEGLRLQTELVAERRAGRVPDTLLLLEHPHVITLGSSADATDVLVDEATRARMGIEVFEVGRGGSVTYHGPGQLVAYPILDLKPIGKDLHEYLRRLEDVLIRTAAALGVEARRREGLTGAWTEQGKLAAIGVRVSSQWITSHGLALNVNNDLEGFRAIVPCGYADLQVSTVSRELGREVTTDEAFAALERHMPRVFDVG